jgi:hypothetical protein
MPISESAYESACGLAGVEDGTSGARWDSGIIGGGGGTTGAPGTLGRGRGPLLDVEALRDGRGRAGSRGFGGGGTTATMSQSTNLFSNAGAPLLPEKPKVEGGFTSSPL